VLDACAALRARLVERTEDAARDLSICPLPRPDKTPRQPCIEFP
jgi:hypothetical protein